MNPQVEILGSHMPTITRLLEERKHLAGDIAEFGVYAGATTVQLAKFDRFVWAFDTFQGIPEESFTEGLDVDRPGKFYPPDNIFRLLGSCINVRGVIGRFEDTLPGMPHRTKIVLAYLDCDLYLSTKYALDWLAEHLVPGGAIVIDDYATHRGIQKAVQEFLESQPAARFDGVDTILWAIYEPVRD